MKISCGTIILNEYNEILLGHSTGNRFFDLPKGQLEENETPIDCAIRECQEETSLILNKVSLIDLGLQKYNQYKKLHLFLYHTKKESIDFNSLVCKSTFIQPYSKTPAPEIDYFQWVNADEILNFTSKNMGALLTKLLPTINQQYSNQKTTNKLL
jgi:8-oxo-dGTP pyrophosphatase MutT (NUDIX family)